MAFILKMLLNTFKPGGVAVIQILTYRRNYRFSLQDYLRELSPGEMELHVLPQAKVFNIATRCKVQVVEVIEDSWTGCRYGEISNTFVFQRKKRNKWNEDNYPCR
jgi:hypothetical protein